MKKLLIILLAIPIFYSCTEKQNPVGSNTDQGTTPSLFTPGSMPTSLSHQNTAANTSRTTTSFFTNQIWHIGSDVMTPVVRWYFNSTSVAPAGYHYKLTFWYYCDYYDPGSPDGWVQMGTINATSLATASYTKYFPSNQGAFWELGLVQAWQVKNSTGASTYLGYAQETEWTWVQVISD